MKREAKASLNIVDITYFETYGLLPSQFIVQFIFRFFIFKLLKIEIRHQIVFDMIHGLIECLDKLEKVFFIKEDLVFFIAEIITVCATLAFGDGQVIIITSGGLNVKKISAFSGFYFFREYLISIVSSMLFHGAFWFGLMIYRILR